MGEDSILGGVDYRAILGGVVRRATFQS